MKLYERFRQFEIEERKLEAKITLRQLVVGAALVLFWYGVLLLFIFAFAPEGMP